MKELQSMVAWAWVWLTARVFPTAPKVAPTGVLPGRTTGSVPDTGAPGMGTLP